MQYLDNQHKILKYLCKFKYGVTKAHAKCLIPLGEDFNKLKTEEKIKYKDCVVDLSKLKALFAERETMTEKDFDEALSQLITDGFLTNQYIVTSEGKKKNKELFKEYYNSPDFVAQTEKDSLDMKTLLFNE